MIRIGPIISPDLENISTATKARKSTCRPKIPLPHIERPLRALGESVLRAGLEKVLKKAILLAEDDEEDLAFTSPEVRTTAISPP